MLLYEPLPIPENDISSVRENFINVEGRYSSEYFQTTVHGRETLDVIRWMKLLQNCRNKDLFLPFEYRMSIRHAKVYESR